MRKIVQKAVIKVITPEIVHYVCDFCGKRCGTRENPKQTWYRTSPGHSMHYCKKTDCHSRSKEVEHVPDLPHGDPESRGES